MVCVVRILFLYGQNYGDGTSTACTRLPFSFTFLQRTLYVSSDELHKSLNNGCKDVRFPSFAVIFYLCMK